ncbi:MAG: DUF4236 domain-containing protein [Muribaculaceae bacterium]|nr:DUF4236 domain-containing protein [Muribaculaceae bacterium]
MGFHIRKSFKAGPVRFNLSKSGIGASIGVKGLRLGTNSQGKSYIHAGRYGLYYKKVSDMLQTNISELVSNNDNNEVKTPFLKNLLLLLISVFIALVIAIIILIVLVLIVT